MYNTKTLLREELLLSNRRDLLSEASLIRINNREHITHVLGIHLPLNENYSLTLRKQIIEEEISFSKMITSINNYVGSAIEKGKESAIQVVDSVKALKDVAILIKDLLLSPEYLKSAVNAIKGVLTKILNNLKQTLSQIISKVGANIVGFSEKFTKLIEHVEEVILNLLGKDGWKGFLLMLGFSTLITFLQSTIFGNLLSKGIDMVKETPNLVTGVSDVLNNFKDFSNTIGSTFEIGPMLTWFTEIGIGSVIGSLLTGVNIINIIRELLEPVIKAIHWNKKLVKKPV